MNWSRPAVAVALVVAACGLTAACGRSTSPQAGIFWSQSPHGGEEERGSIGRARLDGSHVDAVFMVAGKAPAGAAVDGHYVYWANYGSETIERAKLDGSGVNKRFIAGAHEPVGVAVDGGHVYWVNSGPGTIGRASLDGSRVEQHFIKTGDSPAGLAVDGTHIYWTHRHWSRNATRSGNFIGRANLDGSAVELRYINASSKLDAVAVNNRHIYWSNIGEHTIGRANLDGTAVDQRCITPRIAPLENVVEGLAVDGEHVYWTNYPANTIGRAKLDGSRVNERFITVREVPEGIAVAWRRAAGSPAAPSGACVGAAKAPILFGAKDYMPGYYALGWGEVAPATVSNGGAAASGTIFQIHWRSWGGRIAAGRGLHPTYTPHGGYYRRPVEMELRASTIRRCTPAGPLVYARFTAREQVRPGGPMGKWFAWARNMCVPYFH